MIRFLAVVLWLLPGLSWAQSLEFPSNASLTRDISSPLESHAFPTGQWDNGIVPTQSVEGAFSQQVWRIGTSSLTSLQIMRPLREQLRNDRYRIVFECADVACGGFDFRFAVDVLPPPEMQVALNDFRFLTAMKGDGPETDVISILVSRTVQAGYVQVTRVAPMNAAPLSRRIEVSAGLNSVSVSGIAEQLAETGRAVLSDLSFETGSSQLALAEFGSLAELARFLQANINRQIALVGHTDASGELEPNIVLSQRRAASVLERLVGDYGISRSQLSAQGVGFLVPLATNATEEGRTANRRVEAVLLLPADQ